MPFKDPEKRNAHRKAWKKANPEKMRAYKKVHREVASTAAFEIIKKGPVLVCAWAHLGGCEGLLEKDHITPPRLRRLTGYTAHGCNLDAWILSNPKEAASKLQPLCNEHNRFKSDKPQTTKLNASGSRNDRNSEPPRSFNLSSPSMLSAMLNVHPTMAGNVILST